MIGNTNIIAKRLSQRTGKSEEYYKLLQDFLFNQLYKDLTETITTGIFLRKIGSWRIKPREFKAWIYKTIDSIRELRTQEGIKARNKEEEELKRLRYLLKIRNILAIYFCEHRKPYVKKKYEKIQEYLRRMGKLNTEKESEAV